MPRLTVRLLGTPQVKRDGTLIEVDTRKAIALLAYLAATRQVHRRSSLALLLWPDSDRKHARTALRRTLFALNKAAGSEWLLADRTTIGLNLELEASGDLWIDLHRFEELRLACQSRQGTEDEVCRRCVPLLTEAADLYRGDFMAGFTLADSENFDEWQTLQQERWRLESGAVLARLAHCHQNLGTADTAIEYARQWVAFDPLHEPAHTLLMELYAQNGRRSAALRQYQECVRLLDEEFGIEPQPETTAVYDSILQGEVERKRHTVATPQPVAAHPTPPPQAQHNLPPRTTSFVGRDNEMRKIQDLLDRPDCRLVTLVGPGGIGKTRLVLEVAYERVEQFKENVYFVPLGPVSSADFLVATLADALDFTFYGNRGREDLKRQLFDYLREKQMLLVIDNFEHLLEEADVVAELLQQAPAIKILVTSQERLNLREEWLVEIYGLQCPNGDVQEAESCSAFQLFMQRANQVYRGFALTDEEKPYVGHICRLVGGMPLGIELASTWVRMLSCRQIATEIEKSLDFLESSLRNVPERHRSLRAVFERSWQLLSPPERDSFRRLSVFRGGFEAAAAVTVANASLPLLMTLADKSLLRRQGDGRFAIPEVLGEYAREKFRENRESEVEARHADYYLALLAERELDLTGRNQKAALATFMAEIENIRRAWHWAVAHGRREEILRALASFFIFFEIQGWFEEGAVTLAEAAEAFAAGGDDVVVGSLLAGQGGFLVRMSRYEEGERVLARSLAILRPLSLARPIAFALYYRGIVAEAQGRHQEARSLFEESLALCQAAGDRWSQGNVLNALGNVSHVMRAYETARDYYQESLHIRRQLGDQRGIALCYHNLGHVMQALDDVAAAKELYRQSVAIKREIGYRRGVAYSLNNMGDIAYKQGAYDEAQRYLEESLAIFKEGGERRGIAYVLTNLGNIAYVQARYDDAQAWYAEALTIFQEIGDRGGLAFSLEDMGKVNLALGELEAAERWYRQAVTAAHDVQAVPILLEALLGLAQIRAGKGEKGTALTILAAILGHDDLSPPLREEAEVFWDDWSAGLDAGLIAAAREAAETKTWDEIVTALVTD